MSPTLASIQDVIAQPQSGESFRCSASGSSPEVQPQMERRQRKHCTLSRLPGSGTYMKPASASLKSVSTSSFLVWIAHNVRSLAQAMNAATSLALRRDLLCWSLCACAMDAQFEMTLVCQPLCNTRLADRPPWCLSQTSMSVYMCIFRRYNTAY